MYRINSMLMIRKYFSWFTVKINVFFFSKLNTVLNAVQTWMFKRKLNLNKNKTNIMVVGNPLQTRNIDLLSNSKLDHTDIILSTKLRNLYVVVDDILTLKYQVDVLKKKDTGGFINIAKLSKFIDRECMLKLVHGLILTQIDFCNALFYGLPNTSLHDLQMILNAVVRIIVNMPRYSTNWITRRAIELFEEQLNYISCPLKLELNSRYGC